MGYFYINLGEECIWIKFIFFTKLHCVYHSELLGVWILSTVLYWKLENAAFRKLDLFLFSDEVGGDTYFVGSLRKS
jgi:hypothetical protein